MEREPCVWRLVWVIDAFFVSVTSLHLPHLEANLLTKFVIQQVDIANTLEVWMYSLIIFRLLLPTTVIWMYTIWDWYLQVSYGSLILVVITNPLWLHSWHFEYFEFDENIVYKTKFLMANLNIKHKYYSMVFIFLVSLLFWDQTQV